MYKIMVVKQQKSNYRTLYQFLTTDESGETLPVDLADFEALDEKVTSMLNDEGYAKSDFMVVSEVNYDIDAKNYKSDCGCLDGSDDEPVIVKTLHFDGEIKLSDKIKLEAENENIVIEADEITDDLIYDSSGKAIFGSDETIIVDTTGASYTLAYLATEVDEFISGIQKEIESNG